MDKNLRHSFNRKVIEYVFAKTLAHFLIFTYIGPWAGTRQEKPNAAVQVLLLDYQKRPTSNDANVQSQYPKLIIKRGQHQVQVFPKFHPLLPKSHTLFLLQRHLSLFPKLQRLYPSNLYHL